MTLLLGGPLSGLAVEWPGIARETRFPLGVIVARDGVPCDPPEEIDPQTYRRSPLGESLGMRVAVWRR